MDNGPPESELKKLLGANPWVTRLELTASQVETAILLLNSAPVSKREYCVRCLARSRRDCYAVDDTRLCREDILQLISPQDIPRGFF